MTRKKKQPRFFYLRKISQGILLSLVMLAFVLIAYLDLIPGQIFLYETIPYYKMDSDIKLLFKYNSPSPAPANAIVGLLDEQGQTSEADGSGQPDTQTVFKVNKIEETPLADTPVLVGLHDVQYQPEQDSSDVGNHFFEESITAADIGKLRDLSYLKTKFYTVAAATDVTAQDFNVDEFLKKDLSITKSDDQPKVLIFHTHSMEMYKDSAPNDPNDGVIAAGETLCRLLNERGIRTIHSTDRFDLVNGKFDRDGAYERMEPVISRILANNPSIEVAIDLHRDGVNETTHLMKKIDGKPTAQIMFVNGLSKIYKNGQLTPISGLKNKNLPDNLAFSFQLQLAANSLYPGFTRKIYLNAYRYSLHMLPKSVLVEVGAQTNTKEEVLNAMEPLANILTQVVSAHQNSLS